MIRTLHDHPLRAASLIWLVCGGVLYLLDGWFSTGNLALVLVLGSTLASYFMGAWMAALSCALALLAFNWFFVTPRYTLQVLSAQDMLLLLTLLVTSTLISILTSRLRQSAQIKSEQALWSGRLQHLSTEIQHASTVTEQTVLAGERLSQWWGLRAHIWLEPEQPPVQHAMYRAWLASQQEPGPIGPGTGRHESTWDWALPLRAGVLRIGTLCIERDRAPRDRGVAVIEASRPLIAMLADEIHRLQVRKQAQAHERALANHTLRNTLLAAISHDYRTPLATITGLASSLIDQVNEPVWRRDLAFILQESEHLNRITDHTLQLARLDAPDVQLQATWESMEELCGAALAGARRRHPAREVTVHIPYDLPLLHVDPVLVVQLLDNLLDNALQHSPVDQPVVLSAECRQGRVWVRIRDHGVGIPEAWRQKVFVPFCRIPSGPGWAITEGSRRKGMGLGLSLCKAIARIHQAEMGIDVASGGGTEAWVGFLALEQPTLGATEQQEDKAI